MSTAILELPISIGCPVNINMQIYLIETQKETFGNFKWKTDKLQNKMPSLSILTINVYTWMCHWSLCARLTADV